MFILVNLLIILWGFDVTVMMGWLDSNLSIGYLLFSWVGYFALYGDGLVLVLVLYMVVVI